VALNPVRARLIEQTEDWRWSSVGAHLMGRDDGLVSVAPLAERCGGRFADLIESAPIERGRRADRATDRLGGAQLGHCLSGRLAAATGRDPRPKRRGPKPKASGQDLGGE
jgi:putative transposase